ncbi:hypothetical protein [Maribacter sp. HTCC2170]|uniref:hypothetical protein n=1 Tax=Maribacter sp. (strain HTCC2170 / KCCM 42371) TaxID=313603 RepID=UPI00006B4839|nr:hypothetical protein [Maribacter sp. HTCC2170]EAR01593.1 adenylosuccinate lyase [Maribacter sp. HTCC2170]
MTKKELYDSLDYVNHSRDKRQKMASLILSNPHFVEPLMQIAFDHDNPVSSKACWVLEFAAKNKLSYILPNIDLFTNKINKVKLDSSVRPMAKICEFLIKEYYSKNENETQTVLVNKHLEQISSACFDWLIGNHKVAAKAYSMTSLLLLGQTFDWIHPELKMVLEQNYSTGSAAYKARARMTLSKIK